MAAAANAIPASDKDTTGPKLLWVKKEELNITIQYDTLQPAKTHTIVVQSSELECYEKAPNKFYITVKMNDGEFKRILEHPFTRKLIQMNTTYGMRNIKRTMDEFGTQEFEDMDAFQVHMNRVRGLEDDDDVDGPDTLYSHLLGTWLFD